MGSRLLELRIPCAAASRVDRNPSSAVIIFGAKLNIKLRTPAEPRYTRNKCTK